MTQSEEPKCGTGMIFFMLIFAFVAGIAATSLVWRIWGIWEMSPMANG